ncbi:trypsin-like peptidase domain-containing protein [Kitasatospora sp. NBC_01287]|uniref:trypsin-like serine peptidase n=1 Tax=Kitasatospora sp. NBC_01287 TaxID=2903573 RepID=UPI002253567A|nr:trypsin-like peptidase domain-containing protein [Kitasatospora sp. NBC_01287]MCX4746759.1 trypsin-like peptidase domain-containing protein [Kitasatospora sp. NBC_01287]
MTSQQRGHRRQKSRPVNRPLVLVLSLTTAMVIAIACVSLVTSRAAASTRAAAVVAAAKATQSPAAPSSSPSPTTVAPVGPPAPTAAPVAQLPPPAATSPTASLTPSPTAAPSDTAVPAPTATTGSGDGSDGTDGSGDATRSAPTTATAPAGPETDRVGALFSGSATPGNHFCTASVVQSPTRNLLVTAAHCVSSTSGLVFAPAFRSGQTPYGVWQVTQIYSTNGWKQSQDPDQDFAILQVAPLNGRQIQDVVGGNPLGLNESFTATVRLYGYASSADVPILCSNATTQQSAYQRRIDCPAFPGGTSGGPWINTANGDLIGIIGGYQQGGNSPDTSYSAYFDSTIGNLFQLAVSQSG